MGRNQPLQHHLCGDLTLIAFCAIGRGFRLSDDVDYPSRRRKKSVNRFRVAQRLTACGKTRFICGQRPRPLKPD